MILLISSSLYLLNLLQSPFYSPNPLKMLLSIAWVGEFLVRILSDPSAHFIDPHHSLHFAAPFPIYHSLLLFLLSHCPLLLSKFFFVCLCFWPLTRGILEMQSLGFIFFLSTTIPWVDSFISWFQILSNCQHSSFLVRTMFLACIFLPSHMITPISLRKKEKKTIKWERLLCIKNNFFFSLSFPLLSLSLLIRPPILSY